MKNIIGASEFKAKCLSLIDEVAQTGRPLTITKRGKVVAQLVPAPLDVAGFPQETLFGTVKILGDLVEPGLSPDEFHLEDGLI